MSEREWAVVRDKQGKFFITHYEATDILILGWELILRVGKSEEYANGYTDALNRAAEDRSVLPEWQG